MITTYLKYYVITVNYSTEGNLVDAKALQYCYYMQ